MEIGNSDRGDRNSARQALGVSGRGSAQESLAPVRERLAWTAASRVRPLDGLAWLGWPQRLEACVVRVQADRAGHWVHGCAFATPLDDEQLDALLKTT